MQKRTIAIAGTFTAEPVEESLRFWIRQLDLAAAVEFAPYNQVFQQLLDPASPISKNQDGYNVILLRFEDWYEKSEDGVPTYSSPATCEKIERNVRDLALALRSAAQRSATPYLISVCPASKAAAADVHFMDFCGEMEEVLASELAAVGSMYLVRATELMTTYPVAEYDDPQSDKLGHIPYTPAFFAALGSFIARKIYRLQSAPHKVVVLDCDGTLWKGVCGEVGAFGVEIDAPHKTLQEFVVAQHNAGMLVCLCSKNNEKDVVEVLEQRREMPLQRDHILSWRINWAPKSQNLRSLAEELQLGLDSFIFIDDDPVVCAEVQANCPEVLTLQLPQQLDHIEQFLHHVWAFDRLRVTHEDQQRTALYQQNLERERLKQKLSFTDFLANLDLKVQIAEMEPQHLARVEQLTHRTNQFNFTTIRRSASEIQKLNQSDSWHCMVVTVSDRFGEYGLVGVMMFEVGSDAIQVDTFLLSCRALGRGVEHQMLAKLGKEAQQQGLKWVDVSLVVSAKNQPAQDFLEGVGERYKQSVNGSYHYRFPSEYAAALTYIPSSEKSTRSGVPEKQEAAILTASSNNGNGHGTKSVSEVLNRIAGELSTAEAVLKGIELQSQPARPTVERTFVAPRSSVEKKLAQIWKGVLRLEQVGVEDDFFDLGGTSVLAVQLFVQIERVFGKDLPLATLLQAPTVEQLANVLQQQGVSWSSLVTIQPGNDSKPPLFLVHANRGNVLFYRDLARCLGPDQTVKGLQSQGLDGKRPPYTRVEDMAAHYIEEIQALHPEGPYYLGGGGFGARVAFEMARQLHARGQTTHLIILDAKPPRLGSRAQAQSSTESVSSREAQSQRVNSSRKSLQHYVRRLAYHLRHKSLSHILRYFLGNLEKVKEKIIFQLSSPEGRRLQLVRSANNKADKTYVAQVYPGQAVLFLTGQTMRNDQERPVKWSELIAGGVDWHVIPGRHKTLDQEPQVLILGDLLRKYLDSMQCLTFSFLTFGLESFGGVIRQGQVSSVL